MIVMKFGGSSVASADRIRHVAEIVKSQIKRKPVLVLSAMGDTTDLLLETADEALRKGAYSLSAIEDLHLKTIEELGLAKTQKEIGELFEKLKILLSGISLIREMTPRSKDYLVSFGERLAVRIAAAYFNTIRIKARHYDAWDLGFITNSNYGFAELLGESWEKIPQNILPLMEKNELPVVTG
ncbi:MAG: aspartate kinase, partial [Treponema sp.]|nr:aspartate kinase [Treponema sp.]